jgi:hypothetical protein
MVSVQFKSLAVDLSHVLYHHHSPEVVLEGLELIICSTVVIRQDGYAVVRLGSIGVGSVID